MAKIRNDYTYNGFLDFELENFKFHFLESQFDCGFLIPWLMYRFSLHLGTSNVKNEPIKNEAGSSNWIKSFSNIVMLHESCQLCAFIVKFFESKDSDVKTIGESLSF